MKKILFFKLGAIGDTLMTTPLLRQVRKNFPDAEIDYFIGKHSAEALEGNKNLDTITPFDESIFVKKKIVQWLKLIRKIKKEKYNIVFVLDKHWIFNLTAFLAGIPVRVGFDRLGKEGILLTKKVYYGNDKHEIVYYLDLLETLGCKVDYDDWKFELFLNKTNEKFADDAWKKYDLKGKKVIGIAPGGGKNPGEAIGIRNWPIEKYVNLIKKLIEKRFSIILLGKGADDLEKEKEILKINDPRIISFIDKCSIKESAALIKKCNYIICNDTGTMHIASAVNKKIISIFGPTNPMRKAPLWPESRSIWKDQAIYEADYELFGKKPKGIFFKNIKVEDILELIKKTKKNDNK